jgi:hypothetical protein
MLPLKSAKKPAAPTLNPERSRARCLADNSFLAAGAEVTVRAYTTD